MSMSTAKLSDSYSLWRWSVLCNQLGFSSHCVIIRDWHTENIAKILYFVPSYANILRSFLCIQTLMVNPKYTV